MTATKSNSKPPLAIIWLLFCLTPLILSLASFLRAGNENVEKYTSCVIEYRQYLPNDDSAICCMPNGLHHSIQHRKERFFKVSNETMVFFSASYGFGALFSCLFLTPCLILGYGMLTKNGAIERIGVFVTSSAYAFLVLYVIYSIAVFKDS